MVRRDLLPTTFDPLAQCRRLLRHVQPVRVVATGYGRKLLAEANTDLEITTITEIQAYALGAGYLYPGARTILDIGGQDTKAIALGPGGKVIKFEMNDRCAAGTGKFLEFMALALQMPLEKFGGFALQADKKIQISSMCTVFAESEATSHHGPGKVVGQHRSGAASCRCPAHGGHAATCGRNGTPGLCRRGSPYPLHQGPPGREFKRGPRDPGIS